MYKVIGKRRMSIIAGLLYLVVVLTGMFSLAYVPSQLFNWSSPSKTFHNIADNEMLYRMSLAAGVICYIAFTFLPVALYKLLKPVNEFYASLMVLLVAISIPISFINLHHKYVVLDLISAFKYKAAPLSEATLAQMMSHLSSYNNGIYILTIFWGLWLLPFGYLVLKSGFLPKILGILLMLGCCGYLVGFFGSTVSHNYAHTVFAKVLRLLPTIGELGICAWLLIVGTVEKKQVNK